jgi:hypothetical protein
MPAFAGLSTLGCIAVFVVMFRMDRNSRNESIAETRRYQ